MAHWKEQEETYILNEIPNYRKAIERKDITIARKLTREFSERLHRNTPQLQHKDQSLYATLPREDGNKEFNRTNTRHSYNGVVKWKEFGTPMADMVPITHGGNNISLVPDWCRVLERVPGKRGIYRLIRYQD